MWRKLNGTGGAPGVADAVTYTLVWAGGKERSRWRTAGAEEALIDVGGSCKSARPMPFENFAFRTLPGLAVRGGAQQQ